jgi:hypothetical protein
VLTHLAATFLALGDQRGNPEGRPSGWQRWTVNAWVHCAPPESYKKLGAGPCPRRVESGHGKSSDATHLLLIGIVACLIFAAIGMLDKRSHEYRRPPHAPKYKVLRLGPRLLPTKKPKYRPLRHSFASRYPTTLPPLRRICHRHRYRPEEAM